MEIITRDEARERGLKRFFTGVACKHGHIVERYTCQGACSECLRQISSKFQKSDAGRVNRAAWRNKGDNRERLAASTRAWYRSTLAADADAVKAKSKERYKRYHYEGGGRERNAIRQRNRRISDPLFALSQRVSRLILHAVAGAGFTKRSKTQAILGCSYPEFAAHIERQFLPGMTWGNRALWHIDHIVAVSTASSEAEVLSLNHFTNLRPLWGDDNLRKGARAHFLL